MSDLSPLCAPKRTPPTTTDLWVHALAREQPGSKAEITGRQTHFRFSNRPVGVKHFQAIHYCGVNVSHGLALLYGIGTRALPSWDPRTRRNNLYRGLAVSMTAGPSGSANHLIHRPARDIFPLRVELGFPIGSDRSRCHAAAAACSLVQRNSVPSIHIRCIITANRRAKATTAFFIPRRLAICMAQALSQDHFFECSML